jgi:hypothetical protein
MLVGVMWVGMGVLCGGFSGDIEDSILGHSHPLIAVVQYTVPHLLPMRLPPSAVPPLHHPARHHPPHRSPRHRHPLRTLHPTQRE